MNFNYDKVKADLTELADEKYKRFNEKLLPGIENIDGIRMPDIRKILKNILNGKYGDYNDYLKNISAILGESKVSHEEKVLLGLVIGSVNDVNTQLSYMEQFVPAIDNWAVCDLFCGSVKNAGKHKEIFFKFIEKYLESEKEYERRFALIMLLTYYVDEEYIKSIFKICDEINLDGYYVQMGVAWLVSECFVKFPEETGCYLSNNTLDKFTYNKAIQKIIESNRVDIETKDALRKMKI